MTANPGATREDDSHSACVRGVTLSGDSFRPARGTICVLAQPDHFPVGVIVWGSLDYNPATLKLRIDKQDAISWPHKANLKISDLDPEGRHLLTIISDGKPIQSIWFRFTEFSSPDICLHFDSYAAIQMEGIKHSLCKCK
jgi:hypothetical protein